MPTVTDNPFGLSSEPQPTPGPPALGDGVLIRPLHPSDYTQALFGNAQDVLRPPWRHHPAALTNALFETQLIWAGVLAQLVIVDTRTMQPDGVVAVGNPNLRTRTARLWATERHGADPRVIRNGALLVLNYVFANWDLFKLHGEALSSHVDVAEDRFSGLLEREGCLRRHEDVVGILHDLHLLALRRPSWDERSPELVTKARTMEGVLR